jgi:hypothetical protein
MTPSERATDSKGKDALFVSTMFGLWLGWFYLVNRLVIPTTMNANPFVVGAFLGFVYFLPLFVLKAVGLMDDTLPQEEIQPA